MDHENQILTGNQKNKIFIIIEEAGMDPGEFYWTEEAIESHTSYGGVRLFSKLKVNHTPHFFEFDIRGDRYVCEHHPGEFKPTAIARFTNWPKLLYQFSRWVKRVKVELEIPDLWEQIRDYKPLFQLVTNLEDVDIPFTSTEIVNIKDALELTKERIIREFEPVGQKLDYVIGEIEYLKSRAEKGYSRIDWRNILVTTVINIGMNLALDPGKAHQLWIAFQETLGRIFQRFLQ